MSDAAVRELEGLNGDTELAAALATRARMLMLDASFEPAHLRMRAERSNSTHDRRGRGECPDHPRRGARRTGETDAGIADRCAVGLRPLAERTVPEQIARASSISITPTGPPAACAKPARPLSPPWTRSVISGCSGPTGRRCSATPPTSCSSSAGGTKRTRVPRRGLSGPSGRRHGRRRPPQCRRGPRHRRGTVQPKPAAFLDEAFELVRHASSWNTLIPLWYSLLDLSIWRRDWERADAACQRTRRHPRQRPHDLRSPHGRPRDAPPRRGGPRRAGESRSRRAECTARSRTMLAAQLDELVRQRGAPRDPGPRAFIAIARAEQLRLLGTSAAEAWRAAAEAFDEVGIAGNGCLCALREAEAHLAGRSDRALARDTLRQAGTIARRLGARPLFDEIERSLPAHGSMLSPSPTP